METTGRTVEEAKELALDQLGVDELDAEFEVLEEARLGLFGRLRSEARVRARVRPTKPRPKEERRDRRRRRGTLASGTDDDEARSAGGGGANGESVAGSASGSNGGGETVSGTNVEKGEDEDATLEEQAELARSFVAGLVDRFGTGASVDVRLIDDDTVEIDVTGPDLGLLIGPKGSTLAALQELTRTAVQRQTGGRTGRIVVDVAGYRERRREALERFTQQVAADVRATGTRRVLEPMTPADRKIVHDTVNEMEGVTTASEGEEPRRRVVILPAPPAS
ncbi:MAG: RNA-binding cell elongation regulator Jag/EloR [Actinomycetota bacterium]